MEVDTSESVGVRGRGLRRESPFPLHPERTLIDILRQGAIQDDPHGIAAIARRGSLHQPPISGWAG